MITMEEQRIRFAQTVELKQLAYAVLRAWRVLVIAAILMGLLWGGLEFRKQKMKKPEPVMGQEAYAEAANTVTENEEKLAEYEEELPDLKQDLEEWKYHLRACKYSLEKVWSIRQVTPDLVADMISLIADIDWANARINEHENRIEAIEEEILQLQEENNALREEMAAVTSPGISLTKLIKQAILGAFWGVVLVCVVIWQKWMLRDQLHSEKTLKKRLNLDLIGYAHSPVPEKKNNIIDKLLDRITDAYKQVDMSAAYAAAAAKLHLLSKDSGKVLITGTVSKETLEQVRQQLLKEMPDAGMDLVSGGDLEQNAAAISQLANCPVLLVEQIGHTKKSALLELHEFLLRTNAHILGVFVV